MIIGIDESGNFETDQFSVSAAVFIRPRKAGKIRAVFEKWENSLPPLAKEKGEVKGSKLNNKQLNDFVENILIHNGYGRIRYTAVGIQSQDDAQYKMLQNRRVMLAQQLEKAEQSYRENSRGIDVDFCHGMAGWIRGLSDKSYSKFEVLCTILFNAFRFAPIAAKTSGCDKELGMLGISIDSTIIGRPSTQRYWEKILHDDFWNKSHTGEAFIQFSDWGPKHPFVKRFIATPLGTGETEFTEELQKCWSFADSKDKFEVRIADIVSNILYRYYNEPSDEITAVVQLMSHPRWNPYTSPICDLCEFSDKRDNTIKIPSPYEK